MLLGEALIKAGVLSQAQLQMALNTQGSNLHLSLGEVITKLFGIPRDVVESHYINLAIIPFVKEWLAKELNRKKFNNGTPLGSSIAEIAITIAAFTRYEGEAVSFARLDTGMYQESSALTRMERILATVEPLVITTTKQQQIILNDVHLEVNLEEKGVRPDNPGFLSEVKFRLLQAGKEQD